MRFKAVDLFSGCGGMSEGLRQAGFDVIAAVDSDKYAAKTYKLNHPDTVLFEQDIRSLDTYNICLLYTSREIDKILARCLLKRYREQVDFCLLYTSRCV